MADQLLVVDVQRCFLNGLTLHMPARVARLIARGEHAPILLRDAGLGEEVLGAPHGLVIAAH